MFGQPADFTSISAIAKEYNMLILEDGAQGFGGEIHSKKACSFGDIATTSFFPAKPLGCYGDGGAIFTDNEEWADLLRSYRVHGKGSNKYDNVRIGMNSRLDTLQAAVLKVKLKAFRETELQAVNQVAAWYTQALGDMVVTPTVKEGFLSSWAQYSILLKDTKERNDLQAYLKDKGIPSMIYYPKPMSEQQAFSKDSVKVSLTSTKDLCSRVLALPMHPYMTEAMVNTVVNEIKSFFENTYKN